MTSAEASKLLSEIEETGRAIQKTRTAIEVSRARVSDLLEEVRGMGVKLPKQPTPITSAYIDACVAEIKKESGRRQSALDGIAESISAAIREADRKIEEADRAASDAREDGE